MTVGHIEFLVEEASMEALLHQVLPRIIGDLSYAVHAHSCKQDLLEHLPARLRGYAKWIPEDWRLVIVVDRDADDCKELKRRLEGLAALVGLPSRTNRDDDRWVIVNRLAIEELEAWYFGDWSAVRAAYPRVPATIPSQRKYRDPDDIAGGTWEAFERILQRAGYFAGGLRKTEAARTIGANMDPARNTSRSF